MKLSGRSARAGTVVVAARARPLILLGGKRTNQALTPDEVLDKLTGHDTVRAINSG